MFILTNVKTSKGNDVRLKELCELKLALLCVPEGEYVLYEVSKELNLVKILTINTRELYPGGPRSNVCLVAI